LLTEESLVNTLRFKGWKGASLRTRPDNPTSLAVFPIRIYFNFDVRQQWRTPETIPLCPYSSKCGFTVRHVVGNPELIGKLCRKLSEICTDVRVDLVALCLDGVQRAKYVLSEISAQTGLAHVEKVEAHATPINPADIARRTSLFLRSLGRDSSGVQRDELLAALNTGRHGDNEHDAPPLLVSGPVGTELVSEIQRILQRGLQVGQEGESKVYCPVLITTSSSCIDNGNDVNSSDCALVLVGCVADGELTGIPRLPKSDPVAERLFQYVKVNIMHGKHIPGVHKHKPQQTTTNHKVQNTN
jgi:hypothetical protein